jgi:hypothetical protein
MMCWVLVNGNCRYGYWMPGVYRGARLIIYGLGNLCYWEFGLGFYGC